MNRLLMICLLPVTLALPAGLLAAEFHAAPDEGDSIEAITVTASRQASATAATASLATVEELQDVHASHISEVLVQSPGVWISRGNGQEHLTAIRSPVLTGGGGCGPFLMAEDNIALRAPAFCNVNQLFDTNFEQAGRIEVLRGPGTAFHGSSAMHGIINIISPDFVDDPYTTLSEEVESSHQYGRFSVDHRNTNWLLQANAARDEGYKDDSGFDQQKLRVKGRQQGAGWSVTHSLAIANLKQDTAGFVVGHDAYKNDRRQRENPNPDAYRNASSARFHSSLDYRLSDTTTLLLTPYLRSNEMDFLMHFQPGTPVEQNGHDSVGVQSALFHQLQEGLRLVNGVDIDYSEGWLQQIQAAAGPSLNFPQGKQYDYDVKVLTSALFTQAEITFLEKGLLVAGLRLEDARYDYTNHLSDGSACNPAATSCRYSRPADDELSFFNWSPKLTASYEAWADNRIFTTLARAYRAPESSELFRLEQGQVLARIDSEDIRSVETGLYGNLWSQLDYQFSVYYMEKGNVIFKDGNRQNVDNQETVHRGVEAGINAALTDSLLLRGQMTYGKHQYGSNIRLLDGSTSLIKGNIIDTAPRQMHSVILSWLPTNSTQLDIEGIYMGSYYLEPDNRFSYDGHTLTNLRLKQNLPDGWEFAFAILNAFSQDYADRADVTVKTFSDPVVKERYFIGEPRSWRASVSKTF